MSEPHYMLRPEVTRFGRIVIQVEEITGADEESYRIKIDYPDAATPEDVAKILRIVLRRMEGKTPNG